MKQIYSLYDQVAEYFHPPFVADNYPTLARSLATMAQDPQNELPFFRHPDDFVIYQLGDFNDITGKIATREIPERLQSIAQIIRTTEAQAQDAT